MKKFKVDLHLHTNVSYDAVITFDDLQKAYQLGRFDAVAITDHGTIRNAVEFAKKAQFPVIVSEEIKTCDGDVIGLFLKKEIAEHQGVLETMYEIHSQGGLVSIPHPFDSLKCGLPEEKVLQVLGGIDLFETHNFSYGAGIFKNNLNKVIDFAKKYNLTAAAGSDAHIKSEICTAFLEFENTDENILQNAQTFLQNCANAVPKMLGEPDYKLLLKHFTNLAYMKKSFIPNLHCLAHVFFSKL